MLARSGRSTPLAVGTPAPDFTLEGVPGGPYRLSDLLGEGPVALFFYPGNDTPGWNRQLSAVRDEQTRYREQGVRTFGVNPAPLESHARYAAKFGFTFPLLSDPDRVVAAAYRALKAGSRSVERTVYLVGPDGRVAFARRGAPGVEAILAVLG